MIDWSLLLCKEWLHDADEGGLQSSRQGNGEVVKTVQMFDSLFDAEVQ